MKKSKEANRVMCHKHVVRERDGEGWEGPSWLLDTALLSAALPRERRTLDTAQSR